MRFLCALVVIGVIASSGYAAGKTKTGFDAFIVGNPADAPPAPTLSPGLVLMGGGTDVDAAFQWMCQRAGGGDFVVIRTTGTDAYNPYIQQLCPQMDSVETIIITSVTDRDLFQSPLGVDKLYDSNGSVTSTQAGGNIY